MNTTNGKIAEQSKKMIANALLMLMEKENYKDITITQISQEADLSRKTFYVLVNDPNFICKKQIVYLKVIGLNKNKLKKVYIYSKNSLEKVAQKRVMDFVILTLMPKKVMDISQPKTVSNIWKCSLHIKTKR